MNITWDAKTYQQGFSFVPSYGEDVLGLLTVAPGSTVVDLGCGTGALTAKLKEHGYDVTGIDASDEMLATARAERPDIRFERGDAVDLRLDHPVDAIFSNAVMHWIDADKQDAALVSIASNLRPGGEFVFEFGGRGCAETVHATLENIFEEHGRTYLRTFYFPTIGEYAPMVERHGMRVELALLFDRPTPLPEGRTVSDWIRMFDMRPFDGIPADEALEMIDEAERRLQGSLLLNDVWYIDYVRIRMRARKL